MVDPEVHCSNSSDCDKHSNNNCSLISLLLWQKMLSVYLFFVVFYFVLQQIHLCSGSQAVNEWCSFLLLWCLNKSAIVRKQLRVCVCAKKKSKIRLHWIHQVKQCCFLAQSSSVSSSVISCVLSVERIVVGEVEWGLSEGVSVPVNAAVTAWWQGNGRWGDTRVGHGGTEAHVSNSKPHGPNMALVKMLSGPQEGV